MPLATLIQEAANGDANAQYELGYAYQYGEWDDISEEFSQGDDKQAVDWYRKSAEQGHAKAQSALASMYNYGAGVRESPKQAFYWYKKSAEQGYDSAQASLAHLYSSGEGVAQDSELAMFWFRKAADQGGEECQFELAEHLYDYGAIQEAAQWYRLAAESNSAKAAFKLAELYEEGNGVPKNDEEAFRWYLKAEHLQDKESAVLGLGDDAHFAVGRCYAEGRGVRKDSDEALKRLLPIADPKLTKTWLSPMTRAQFYVVHVFCDPEHARHDLVKTYVWLNLLASYVQKGQQLYTNVSGDYLAQERDELGARLSHAQLQAAQQRSFELFVPIKVIEERLGYD